MLSITDHLTQVITTLRAAIAACAHPLVQREPARAPFFVLLHNRVGRAARLFIRLYTLWQQDNLSPPRPSQAGATRTARAAPAVTFPRGRAWLVALTDYRVAGCGSQLQHFLQRPDLPAFLAAAPQAVRHLRPLCRMLGAELPPGLQPTNPSPRPPKIRPPKSPQPPAAPPAGTPDRPIPRNVLAAARAWRRRYG